MSLLIKNKNTSFSGPLFYNQPLRNSFVGKNYIILQAECTYFTVYMSHDVDNFATLKSLCTSFECLALIHKLSDIINLCTVLCWYVVAQVGTLYNLLKDNMLVPVLYGIIPTEIYHHMSTYTL